MTTTDKIKRAIPIHQDFKIREIADKVFPHLVLSDTEGRIFNRGSSTVARLLRKMPGILEVSHLVFWADDYAKD